MNTEKRQLELEELYKDLDQIKLVGIILELTIENIELKKQLSIHDVSGSLLEVKTPIANWNGLKDCSLRLFNNIRNIKQLKNGQLQDVKYVEDISKSNFTKTEGLGIKSWREFVELRGY